MMISFVRRINDRPVHVFHIRVNVYRMFDRVYVNEYRVNFTQLPIFFDQELKLCPLKYEYIYIVVILCVYIVIEKSVRVTNSTHNCILIPVQLTLRRGIRDVHLSK